MIPTFIISFCSMKPVECAMALGGVLMGRIIDTEDAIATPTISAEAPPICANASPATGSLAIPLATRPRMGASNDAAAECEMKFENKKHTIPEIIITIRGDHVAKGID